MEKENPLTVANAKACPRTLAQIRVFSILGIGNDPDQAIEAGAQFAKIYDISGDVDPESIAAKISNVLENGGR